MTYVESKIGDKVMMHLSSKNPTSRIFKKKHIPRRQDHFECCNTLKLMHELEIPKS